MVFNKSMGKRSIKFSKPMLVEIYEEMIPCCPYPIKGIHIVVIDRREMDLIRMKNPIPNKSSFFSEKVHLSNLINEEHTMFHLYVVYDTEIFIMYRCIHIMHRKITHKYGNGITVSSFGRDVMNLQKVNKLINLNKVLDYIASKMPPGILGIKSSYIGDDYYFITAVATIPKIHRTDIMYKLSHPNSQCNQVCRVCRDIRKRPNSCTRCRRVWYCSKRCQKIGWKEHKNICHYKGR